MTAEAPRRVGRPPALTDAEVEAIRNDAAAGTSQKSLAEAYGISRTLVSMICRGRRYPDAPGPITYSYAPPTTQE